MPKGPTAKEISKYLKGEMLPGSMVPERFVRDAKSQSKKSSVLAPKKKYEKAIKAVKVNVQDNRPKGK
tara:strand:+ start:32 stop:235 length:204 start_codon:yes stop_codon:yes gene_type:complete